MSEIKTNSMLPAFRARALSRVMELCVQSQVCFSAQFKSYDNCYLCELKKIRDTRYLTYRLVSESIIKITFNIRNY